MYLIFDTQSTNPDYYGDCDCAVVEMTPALVSQVRSRVALAQQAGQQDNDLYEMSFWGSTAEFYDSMLVDACEEAVALRESDDVASKWAIDLEETGYAVLPPGVDLAAHEPQRIELSQVIIRCRSSLHQPEFEICWTASPKNSDVYVTTKDLPLKALKELLAAEHQQGRNLSIA